MALAFGKGVWVGSFHDGRVNGRTSEKHLESPHLPLHSPNAFSHWSSKPGTLHVARAAASIDPLMIANSLIMTLINLG